MSPNQAEPLPAPAESYAWLAAVVLSTVAFIAVFFWNQSEGYNRLDADANQRMDLYIAHVTAELAKNQYLPDLLDLDDTLLELLRKRDLSTRVRERANRNLAKIGAKAGVQELFLLDAAGTTVAASNWYLPETTIGKTYADSPIYTLAIQSGEGGYYLPNTSRSSPEYYFSQVIRRSGQVLGVAVAKVSLDALVSTWVEGSVATNTEKVVVLDQSNLIVLSSVRGWLLHTLETPYSIASAKALESAANSVVIRAKRKLPYGAQLVELPQVHGTSSDLNQAIAYTKKMTRPNWRMMLLVDVSEVNAEARNAGIAGASITFAICALIMHWQRRRREIALRLSTRDFLRRANDELGQRVAERTSELATANSKLIREIGERERTEVALRQTLDELVQAGKMALLGQMAAGITHEINQPLTALRALSRNSRLLIDRGQIGEAVKNLQSISDLTERIEKITSQLKTFGRKGPALREAVNLQRAVENSLLMLENRLTAEGIETRICVPSDLRAWCDHVRIEQVLVNLLANSIDAFKEWVGEKILAIECKVSGERVLVKLTDTGPGIPSSAISKLFEPFFTTKPPGEGLGLGLVISASIIAEFGGTLRVLDLKNGAGFEFELTVVEETQNV